MESLHMADAEDLYEILQLHHSAHQNVIDAAYQRLAELYHPAKDPSPEAAAKLAAVSRAYAVLGDPEKRAAYDRDREAEAAGASAKEEGLEPESPKPRSRKRTKQRALDYITVGSTKEDVARIQGPPSSTRDKADSGLEGETWYYGGVGKSSGNVFFDKRGRVEGWINWGGFECSDSTRLKCHKFGDL